MVKKHFDKIAVILIATIGLGAIIYWLLYNPVQELSVSNPGLDNRPPKDSLSSEDIIIGEKFTKYIDHTSTLNGQWPRFRGEDFDNINKEKIKLINSWGDGPKILWNVALGEGHAAPVIQNGKVYILDYHEIKKSDQLRCFSLETGEEIWRRWYKVKIKRNHGMSRTVPAITKDYIVTIGPRGHVMCCNPDNGDFLWGIDLEKDQNTEIPFWYTGQCPIIENNTLILAPGGKSLLSAYDCSNGNLLWETPNPDNWKMSHSSIIPMTFKNTKMYVYAAIGGICGVAAEGENTGKILWKTNEFAPSVVAPSPVILKDGKIFITAGYGAGSMLFQLVENGNGFSVKVLQKFKPKDGIASEQQTPILYKNRLFSIVPKDAGAIRSQFVCCNPNDCQNILWTSGKDERFGLGPYIIADEKFFILDDNGTITIAKADISKFSYLDKAQIIEGQDAWGPLAIADGKLIMRDSKKMVCIDITANNN